MNHKNPLLRGFTFIELMVIVSIMGLLALGALGAFRGARSRAVLADAQASIMHAFEVARNRAATGVGTAPHGVHVEPDRIVSFEGAAYAGEGKELRLPFSVSTDQASTTVVFARLSAQPNASTTITLLHNTGATSTVKITQYGVILPE